MKKIFTILKLTCAALLVLALFGCKNNNANISATNNSQNNYTEQEDLNADSEEKATEVTTEEISEDTLKKKLLGSMDVATITGIRDEDKSTSIEIEYSKEIEDKFDGAPYIKIEPSIGFTCSKVGRKLIVRGDFNTKETYKVTVLSGVRAVDGTKSEEEKVEYIQFEQKKPKIMFASDGIILPSVNEKRVFIRSLNVKRVKIIIKKIYANNTTQFLQKFDFSGNGTYNGLTDYEDGYDGRPYDYEYDYDFYSDEYTMRPTYYEYFNYVGDEILNQYYDIENEIDTWVQTAVDLSGIIDNNGMYMISLSFQAEDTTYIPNNNSYYYPGKDGNISKTILLTDIGIMAKKTETGYKVNVLNILNNNYIRGAKVSFISKNNQILEEKTTDANGEVEFTKQKNGFYILAETGSDRSILKLQNALSTNGFSVEGAYVTDGINGFIYTERGVYRPGDPIYVSIIARNNNKPIESNQPIKITVYDPTGIKIIENDVLKDGKDGFYTYKFDTDLSSRTGIWKLEATIGNQIFNKDISVEEVVPNKIKVNINIPDVVNYEDGYENWTLSSNYLFGEPAGNLDYSVTFDASDEPIDFVKYKDYTFTTPTTYRNTYSKYVYGKLDSSGIANLTPNLNDIKFGSLNLLMDVSGRVTEDSGRNVVSKKFVKLKKYDTYIGLENTSVYKKPGSELGLKAICVTEDGENLIAGKKLKYRLYGNDCYWWWDYSKYDNFIRSFKSDKHTTLLEEGDFVTEDVPVVLKNIIPNTEYIYVEIEDETTGQIVGVNLQSSEWIDPSVTKKIETINIIADKKSYQVGETAQISFKGSNSSKAIFTIEKAGKIIDQFVREVKDGEYVENIKITKDMTPNIYAYVTLLQDYNTKENDRPLRLYGVTPINVIDEDTKVDLEIEAPEEIKPNEKFTVKIKNKKNKQVDFTIAVVDEGLLDITAFKTPAPWEYFFRKLASNIMLYDNYSEIIDRPYGAINQILKVGGDESLLDEMARRKRLKELGLEDAERFKPVSMYKGILTTDKAGEASVDFEMPSYMGSVRIMVIAADQMSFGSAEKNMIVRAPLIIQPNLPRNMKIGDKLNIPVSVFALQDAGEVNVYYTFDGNTKEKTLNLTKGMKEIVYFEDEIGNEVKNVKITVGVKSDIYNYEETVGMAINSNNPVTEKSETKDIKGKGDVTFKQEEDFVKGTVDSFITISNKMMLGLDKRLKYLISYPYGCAEQTTSAVFPQLFIDKLSTTKNYDKGEIIKNINAGIDRLKLMQLSNGSFSYWPGSTYTSEWATNYIGHFLIYAKQNGFYVPDTMYDNWIKYTSSKVRSIRYKEDDINRFIDLKCYSLFTLALAGKQNVSEMNYMYEKYNASMNYSSKMYLAAAYKLIGEKKVADNISSSINAAKIKKMYEENIKRDRYYYSYNYGSELRELAVYLDCYYIINDKIDEEAFKEVLTSMRTSNWYSTQTTAYCLLALSNIVSEKDDLTIKGTIDIDGVVTEYSTSDIYRLRVDENAKNIKVTSLVDANTYVNYYWEAVPINSKAEDYSEGFSIERKFYNNQGSTIDESTIKSGETFWLEVDVLPTTNNVKKVENIALTQILPSGWEIENLRVTNTNAPKWVADKMKDTEATYTDIRDDRVMWFFDFNNGSTKDNRYRFFVKLNAVTKGEFDFPGTSLEAMYDNNFRAYKKGKKVKVD